jgi:hypothetical protein
MAEVPTDLRARMEPAQIFHEILEHRWYLSEQAAHSVPFLDAVRSYVDTVLVTKPDERAVIGSRSGSVDDATAELRIVVPPEGD